MSKPMTREKWLNELTDALRPLFLEAGGEIPEKVRATCGWPSQGAKAKKKQVTGECWDAESSGDQHFEIFITPLLDDGNEIAGVLVHELCHAALGISEGHRSKFKKLATGVGLEGKMTATTVGEELAQTLEALVAEVGSYPHAKISFDDKKKRQSTRMLKLVCVDPACGYTVRTTRKWVSIGLPTCPCGKPLDVEEAKEKPPEGGEEEGGEEG